MCSNAGLTRLKQPSKPTTTIRSSARSKTSSNTLRDCGTTDGSLRTSMRTPSNGTRRPLSLVRSIALESIMTPPGTANGYSPRAILAITAECDGRQMPARRNRNDDAPQRAALLLRSSPTSGRASLGAHTPHAGRAPSLTAGSPRSPTWMSNASVGEGTSASGRAMYAVAKPCSAAARRSQGCAATKRLRADLAAAAPAPCGRRQRSACRPWRGSPTAPRATRGRRA